MSSAEDPGGHGSGALATACVLIRRAVERVAAADPNPADPFRGLYVSDELALSLAGERQPPGDVGRRLESVGLALELDATDLRVLALCVAPELDPRYSRLFAYLHDDVTRKLPSPRLVAALLRDAGFREEDVLARFARGARLRRLGVLRLIGGEENVPLAERGVRVGEPLVGHLLGARLEGSAAAGRLRRVDPPPGGFGRDRSAAELRRLVDHTGGPALLVLGADAPELLACALHAPVILLAAGAAAEEAAAGAAMLEAALLGGRLAFSLDGHAADERRAVLEALRRFDGRLLVCARSRDAVLTLEPLHPVVVEVPQPTLEERRSLWRRHAGAEAVEEVAAKFRHSGEQILAAAAAARASAAAAGRASPDSGDLHEGARQASSRQLEELAVRLRPGGDWSDLILPERTIEMLESVSAYLRHRDLVLGDWGYGRAISGEQGLKVLFYGDSGTGKTLAARVLAGKLGLELYRIDLATVVSKYIGETEKNLGRIFAAARDSNAILFFDEADALFGKRSEVSDAHDRYANIEVAYLLQEMESYPGAVILATNYRSNIDSAFMRRLDLAVEFPFPAVEQREAIWRRLLPAQAPLADDVDPALLARTFKLSGGSIRNCSVTGAFLAAADGGRVSMRHLVRAVSFEYLKLGRLTVNSDFDELGGGLEPASLP